MCVGELPDAGFGESGGGTGLRVNFKTAYNGLYEMLELWYAEVMLHQVPQLVNLTLTPTRS